MHAEIQHARTLVEVFAGPHTIHGVETFDFCTGIWIGRSVAASGQGLLRCLIVQM